MQKKPYGNKLNKMRGESMPELPGRLEFWNIGYPFLGILVYITVPIAMSAIAYGFHRRYKIWSLGRQVTDFGPWRERIKRSSKLAFLDIFGHRRFIKRELYPGIMHFFLFWGMLFLLIATTLGALEFNWHKYIGPHVGFEFPTSYLRTYTGLIWDVLGGGFLLIGICMAFYRRYVIRPKRLNTFIDDWVILSLLLGLTLTGFLLESLRIASTELDPSSELYAPLEARWSIIGYLFALPFRAFDSEILQVAHFSIYWLHLGMYTVGFIYVAASFSKLAHIFLSPVNAFLRSFRPLGALRPMGELEHLERFGAADVTDFTWKQLLEYDSCTNCGRCQDQCPAWASGKPLSPRKLIQNLKGYMEEQAPKAIGNRKNEANPLEQAVMATDVITEEVLWSCTTCRACMEACPVFIEHIDSIVDMRRFLVMEQSSIPDTAQTALQSIEQRGHPWRGTTYSRLDWTVGLDVPTVEDLEDFEVLFWVGCTGALEQRSQAIPKAMVSILKAAGVKYAILGNQETCSGDPARRMGNEYLFQIQAGRNIETLNKYKKKRILTICPHCFNTIKNEYPQLDGVYHVQHYVEFVNELLQTGRLKPIGTVNTTLTYHDSCYLGRHNGIYDQPRAIANSIPGVKLVEMDSRNRERGFCCGAGGGRMWMDESGLKVNHIRTEHVLDTDARVVGSSCPFCLQMLNEGLSSKDVNGERKAMDLLEILASSVEGNWYSN
ncbi:(Fe-S)-binding protein [SAR202 cluster bacterium AD-802-E10_MRT_200m]|nr:(Fe-S)-binding protein [SAR202 cluster bacterium AD-802-E10_MRT_200m]